MTPNEDLFRSLMKLLNDALGTEANTSMYDVWLTWCEPQRNGEWKQFYQMYPLTKASLQMIIGEETMWKREAEDMIVPKTVVKIVSHVNLSRSTHEGVIQIDKMSFPY